MFGSFLAADTSCYSLSGHDLFRQGHFLFQWALTTAMIVPYHSNWHFDCLSFSSSFISFSIIFYQLSFTAEPSSFAILTSRCGYCYRCHAQSLSLLLQGSGLLLSVSVSWSGSVCKAHIALHELQAVTMIQCRMAFQLSGNVVALHLDNCS